MEKVTIESIKEPGVTKEVAPIFATILVDKLKLYRRVETAGSGSTAAPKPRQNRYRRRDMQAEE